MSLMVFYEKASTFFPNDLIHAAVCSRKEPLREESLIIGKQCPKGALQLKTLPSISTHIIPILFACHYLGCKKNPLLICLETDDSKSHTSHIRSFL